MSSGSTQRDLTEQGMHYQGVHKMDRTLCGGSQGPDTWTKAS